MELKLFISLALLIISQSSIGQSVRSIPYEKGEEESVSYLGKTDNEIYFFSSGNEKYGYKICNDNIQCKDVRINSELPGINTITLMSDRVLILQAGLVDKQYRVLASYTNLDGSELEKPFVIFERPDNKSSSYYFRGITPLVVVSSPDDSKILVAHLYKIKDTGFIVVDYTVFDQQVNAIYSQKAIIPYDYHFSLLTDIRINNLGEVFFLVKKYPKEDGRDDLYQRNECYLLRTSQDTPISIIRLNPHGDHLLNLAIKLNNKNQLLVCGFYNTPSNPAKYKYDGVYTFRWNSAQDTAVRLHPFTPEINLRLTGSSVVDSRLQVHHFSIDDIHQFSNGNYLLLVSQEGLNHTLRQKSDILSIVLSDTSIIDVSIFKRHTKNNAPFVSAYDEATDSVFLAYKHSKGSFDNDQFSRGSDSPWTERNYTIKEMSLDSLFLISIGKNGGCGVRKIKYGMDLFPGQLIKINRDTWVIPTLNRLGISVFNGTSIGLLNPARNEQILVIEL